MTGDVSGSGSGLTTNVVYIFDGQRDDFDRRLERLNRKAKKFGLDPVQVLDAREQRFLVRYEYVGRDGEKLLTTHTPVGEEVKPGWNERISLGERIKLRAPLVKLGDWEVVGKLEAMAVVAPPALPELAELAEDAGGEVESSPATPGVLNLRLSVTDDEADREALRRMSCNPLTCDHCKTSRRRKDAYVLKDRTTGRYMEVGSGCLEDFTGVSAGQALFLADLYEMVRVVEGEFEEGIGGQTSGIYARDFLVRVAFLVENGGFVSREKAERDGLPTTGERAVFGFNALMKQEGARKKFSESFGRLSEYVQNVLEWAKSLEPKVDFEWNLKAVALQDWVRIGGRGRSQVGILAAAVPAYERAMNRQNHLEEQAKLSRHIGSVGDKNVRARVTVSRVTAIEGQHGMSFLVVGADESGNQVKWFTGSPGDGLYPGDGPNGAVMDCKFTIKCHSEYKGVAQTDVLRLKVLGWVSHPNTKFDPAAQARLHDQQAGEGGDEVDDQALMAEEGAPRM